MNRIHAALSAYEQNQKTMNLGRKIMPFALRKNGYGEWIVLNKSLNPIGTVEDHILNTDKLPVRFKLKSLGEQKLLSLAVTPEHVQRDSRGEIRHVQLYKVDSDRKCPEYLERLEILNNLKIKQI